MPNKRKEGTVGFLVRMPSELRAKIRRAAEALGLPVQTWARELLAQEAERVLERKEAGS